ncbi:transcriptional regulator, partial [Acinetobacter baumannii]
MTNSLLNDLNVVDSSLNTSNLNANTNSKRKTLNLPLSRIKLDPANVRRSYDEVYINELAESINDVGLLQSISVRPDEENPGEYII